MALRTLILPVVPLALFLSDCKSRTAEPPKRFAEATDSGTPPEEEPLPFKLQGTRQAGMLDVRNRYPSTVVVETQAPTQAGVDGECSGVLLSPQVVLTAGHCVCVRQRVAAPGATGRSVINGSACARRPTVTTLIYDPPKPGMKGMPGSISRAYDGVEVRPHPDLQVILDEQGRVESSRADLAIILLNEPVEGVTSYSPLAEADVQAGEPFVMVGYTYDRIVGGISGQRRFSQYQIEKIMPPGDDRVLFAQPGRDLYEGDSGGPCLREGAEGPALIGVSGRAIGESPTFTRTHPYQGWLASELKRASRLRPDLPHNHQPHASPDSGQSP